MVVGRAELASYDGLEVPLDPTSHAAPEFAAMWDDDASFSFSGP